MNPQKLAVGVALMLAAAAAVWVWKRGIGGVAEDVATGAVQAAGGAATGAVKGVGSVVGIPETDADLCRIALEEGNYFDASLYCPAGEFLAAGGSAFWSWFSPENRAP